MQFEQYKFIWWFWGVAAFVVLAILFEYRRRARLSALWPATVWRLRLPAHSTASPILRFIFLGLAFTLMGLALMRPFTDLELREVKRQGVDLYFLVDLSQSMDAADISPTRLVRAKREILDFTQKLTGDRVGLIGFAGTSFVYVPLTTDYRAFMQFADELTTDSMPIQGTDIKGALEKAVQSFLKFSNSASKAVVLITDGEDSVGLDEATMAAIKKMDVKVFVMGMGTPEGGPIPLAEGGYKNDAGGQVVVTKLNEEALKALAVATGGAYVRSVTGDLDLEQIYFQGIKKSFTDEAISSQQVRLPKYAFGPFLILALIFVILEILTTGYRWFWLGKILKRLRVTLPLAAVFILSTPQVWAYNPIDLDNAVNHYLDKDYENSLSGLTKILEKSPEDPIVNFHIGNNYFRLDKFSDAKSAYEKALNAKDQDIRKQALYNLGNSLYRLKDLEGALDAYDKAMKIDADFTQAKLNYEFVKREQEKQQQEQKNQENQENQEQEQDKNDKDSQQQNQQKQEEQKQQENNQDQNQDQNQDPKDSEQKDGEQKDGEQKDGEQKDGEQKENQSEEKKDQDKEQKGEDQKSEDQQAQNQDTSSQGATPGSAGDKPVTFDKEAQAEQWLESIEDKSGEVIKQMLLKQAKPSEKPITKDW